MTESGQTAGGPAQGDRAGDIASAETRRTEQAWVDADETPPPRRHLPGVQWVILGSLVAVLAPLFGFLVGSMSGIPKNQDALHTLFVPLVVGINLGAIGALVAFAFGIRLYRHLRENPD